MNGPNIFEYQNYRAYLLDYYNDQKKRRKYFSYRYFAKKAEVQAPTFLYYVIQNKRNMTLATIAKFARAIGLSADEAAYFENLVLFNQANTIAEKVRYYQKLIDMRRPIDIQEISKDRFEFYSCWYHGIIREAVTFFDFGSDFGRLGRFIEPPLSARQAQESVTLLEKLGFIDRDESGHYFQTSLLVKARTDSPEAFVLQHLHVEMMNVAIKAFDAFDKTELLGASTTFSISRSTFELFKAKAREFRLQLMEIARLDEHPERVYQLTMNLFPVSKTIHDKDL